MGYKCPKGAYCPSGITQEIKCPPGTYNDLEGQSTVCFKCPLGKVCQGVGMISPDNCQPGHYCPLGSIRPVPCPPGTLNIITSGASLTDCSPCPAGKYCETWGLSNYTGVC